MIIINKMSDTKRQKIDLNVRTVLQYINGENGINFIRKLFDDVKQKYEVAPPHTQQKSLRSILFYDAWDHFKTRPNDSSFQYAILNNNKDVFKIIAVESVLSFSNLKNIISSSCRNTNITT